MRSNYPGLHKKELLFQGFFWLLLFSLHLLYYLQFTHVPKAYLLVQICLNYTLFILLSNLYYYVLAPKILRSKWWLFLILSMLLLIGIPLAKHYIDVGLMYFFKSNHILLYGKDVPVAGLFIMRFVVYAGWAGLAVFIRLIVDLFKAERKQVVLSNQKLQSEMDFLRSQMSPHFLFNTLNNIYALAYKKSDDTAEVVMKLSLMLRYMLYETTASRVPLIKEVNNLQRFIDLQKLRSKKQELAHFEISGSFKGREIAPLLLIPLVENAYKHGNVVEVPVYIQLLIEPKQLHVRVKNNYKPLQQKDAVGGVGLINIQRRLELLYPNKHQMQIKKNESTFEVNLTIQE